VIIGKDIGLFTGPELVKYGVRGAVFPAIKDEWHEEREVFHMSNGEALRDSEGKSVHYCLFKRQVNAQAGVLQEGDIDYAFAQSSVVGISTAEPGLQRLRQIVDRMRDTSGKNCELLISLA